MSGTENSSVVGLVAQAIRDSNGTPEALAEWTARPQLVPAAVYARAAIYEVVRILMADRIVCPVHGIPDCGPLLNGCSLPRHLAEYRGGVVELLTTAP